MTGGTVTAGIHCPFLGFVQVTPARVEIIPAGGEARVLCDCGDIHIFAVDLRTMSVLRLSGAFVESPVAASEWADEARHRTDPWSQREVFRFLMRLNGGSQ